MIPSSWYRVDELSHREQHLRHVTARRRHIGPLRRRLRWRRS